MTATPPPDNAPITELLVACRSGDAAAEDALFQRVYGELRRIANAQIRMRGAATMAPTELVHETYLKLLGAQALAAEDRNHFYSLAARAMRQILVDAVRRRLALKRGGDQIVDVDLGRVPLIEGSNRIDLLALDAALEKLQQLNPRLVRIVELRHFAGLSHEEIATTLGLSERTARRDWRTARAFLYDQLQGS